ncbi:TetR/AcrR family transcriptional regulator [Streptococcus orisasini]|uniref:TetR/AcrR family transcriptional regulator n=1 Tax=Streptococcus orisasini TaxID=1080071 RepID=UPI00070E0C2D|nr:TetR/AcrR family transcriptional regulator [Streptococcus orisasini]
MVQRTHENIINAVFRIASKNPKKRKLSLSEIADEVGISRQAIYSKHFSNVDDIFAEIHSTIDREIFQKLKKALDEDTKKSIYVIIAELLLPKIYERREWIRVLYNTSIDPEWKEFLTEKYVQICYKYFSKKHLEYKGNLSLINIVRSICEYILSIIASWISDEFPILPNIFADEFLNLMNSAPSFIIDINFKTY